MIYSALAVALLPAFAAAQTVHTVQVAPSSSFSFSPNTITGAASGDIINFVFETVGHSVTQTSADSPCVPLSGGFNSGIVNTANAQWNVTLSSTDPIWYYCAQTAPSLHCELGMVGAINPPSQDAFTSFSSSAKAAKVQTTVTAVALTGSGAAATATPAAGGSGSGSSSSNGGSTSTTGNSPANTSNAAEKPLVALTGVTGALLTFLGAAFL